MTITIPRLPEELVADSVFVRPQRPDDHAEFEWLLPQMMPLFVYADEDGRDWVRWSMPRAVAEKMGWGEMQCACCGTTATTIGEHSLAVTTARDEIAWFADRQGWVIG